MISGFVSQKFDWVDLLLRTKKRKIQVNVRAQPQ